VTNKEALDLALMTLERDNLKVGNIYVNYDIQKALIKLVKKELEKEEMMKRVMDEIPDMPIKVQDKRSFEEFAQSFAQSARVNGIPEPEPVAYINIEERELEWAKPMSWNTPTVVKMDKVPLYTTPPKREWHELTDGEIATIKNKYEFGVNSHSFISAVRELETWLKERNNG
jgi:hypothetical protein